MSFLSTTLRAKLIILYSLIIGVISLFIWFFFPSQLEKQALLSISEKANSIAVMASYNLGASLYFNDEESGQEILKAIKQNRDLIFCVVADNNKKIFTSIEKEKAKELQYNRYENDTIVLSQQFVINTEPIIFNKRYLGTVFIALSLAEIQTEVQKTKQTIAIVSFLIFFFGVGTIFSISTLLTRPLYKIVETFNQIAKGNFSLRADISSNDEFGKLTASFNSMVEQVERGQQELQAINKSLERRVDDRTQALRVSEERYRKMVEYSPDAIGVHSEGKLVYVNPSAVTLFNAKSKSELLGKSIFDLVHPHYRAGVAERLKQMSVENKIFPVMQEKLIGLDGVVFDAEVSGLPLIYDNKPAVQVVVRDISERVRNDDERKKLEQQLLAAQKMESIGTLAGGIAHDFNNILAIINGYAEIIKRMEKEGNPKIAQHAEAIRTVSERGSILVKQLLTFARKTDTKKDIVEVNTMVGELVGMISQTFPRVISIETKLEPELPLLSADQNNLYQAFLNLCVNARDALIDRYESKPGKNVLSITTHIVDGHQLIEKHPAAEAMPYICVGISDTGNGIPENVIKRIFEPFFTTKKRGQGTGLGLAVVYGIINSHKGFIDVQSTVGQGTTFYVYLPASPEIKRSKEVIELTSKPILEGTETILLIEDEKFLLDACRTQLENYGYNVLTAADGEEAVSLFAHKKKTIDLVISDLGLPKMDGWNVFRLFKAMKPNVKFIISSGFIEVSMRRQMMENGVAAMVDKPYDFEKMAGAIRLVLDKQKV